MPDDNLGIAHGKIRITYEDKGSAQANAAMAKMAAQMDAMQATMQKMESHLGITDKQLKQNASSFEKTAQSSTKFSRSLDENTKSANRFHRDAQKIIDDLQEIQENMRQAQGHAGGLSSGLDGVGASSGRSTRNINRQNAALQAAVTKFSGVERSMKSMTKSMEDNNNILRENERHLRRTADATNDFSMDIFGTRRRIRSFIGDVRDTNDDLTLLFKLFGAGKQKVKSFATFMGVLNQAGAGGSNVKQRTIYAQLIRAVSDYASASEGAYKRIHDLQQTGINIFFQMRKQIFGMAYGNQQIGKTFRATNTLLIGGFTNLRNKILGVDKAVISKAPRWVQDFNRLLKVTGALSTAFIFMGNALGPFKLIERIAASKVFDKIGLGTNALSRKFQDLGIMTERAFGKNLFNRFASELGKSQGRIAGALDRNKVSAVKWAQSLENGAARMKLFKGEATRLIGGFALLSTGLGSLHNRFQWFFKLPKPLLSALIIGFSRGLPAALQETGKALHLVSNLAAGLWSGVTQLAGGFTILPGLIATVGAGVTGLIPIFAGLKDKFKDVFSDDPEKAMAAYYKMPEALRPVTKALLGFKDQWKDLQKGLQETATIGLDDQINKLGSIYFPIYAKGARQVVLATRDMKDQLVAFLAEAKTQSGVSAIYSATAGTMRNISGALKPAAEGLRDMSVVGAQFIRTMTSFAPVIANVFNKWANVNATNGNMAAWMQRSVSGVYDLVHGFESLAKTVYSVLTLFQTKNEHDGLASFADSMDKLNKKVAESKITGTLAKIRNYFQQDFGQDKIKDLKDLFHSLNDAFSRTLPFLHNISNAFSGIFIPMLEHASWAVSMLLKVLNELGLTGTLGTIMGWVFAFRTLPKVLATAIDSFKVIIGLWNILAVRGKVWSMMTTGINAVAIAMTRFGSVGEKLGTGLSNITLAGSKIGNMLATVVTSLGAAGIAAMAFFAVYSSGKDSSDAFNKQLKDNETHLLDFKDALKKAFIDDRGMTGSNVMSAVSAGLNTMMQDVESTAAKMPGMGDHIYDLFFRTLDRARNSQVQTGIVEIDSLFAESDTINNQQAMATASINAANGFKKLRDAGVDLSAVITSSDEDFKEFIDRQRKLGDEGNAVADRLQKERDAFEQMQKALRDAGPAAIELADGVQQIAKAGGDATAKLDGMKKILEAMGILKTTALQTAADYEQGIADLTSKVEGLTGAAGALQQSDLMQGGTFNVATQSGRDFFNVMRDLGDKFLASVAAGNSADAAYKEFSDQLQTISDKTGISIQDLQALAQQVGVMPKFAEIAIQITGKDPAIQALFQAMLAMQSSVSNGIQVPIVPVPGGKSAKEIDDLLEKTIGKDLFDSDKGVVVIKPGVKLEQSDISKVMAKLQELGVKVPGMPMPGPQQQAQIPIKPTINGDPQAVQNYFNNNPNATSADPRIPNSITDDPDEYKKKWDAIVDGAKSQGEKFDQALADGIKSNSGVVSKAAEDLAAELKSKFHQSPPKSGPLSAHGDAAVYAGAQFANSYAKGLYAASGTAVGAASNLAGRVGSSVSTAGANYTGSANAAGASNYAAGKFLGQITQMVDFASHFVDALGKLSDTIFNAAKFISDPLGKGTFFGKSLKWSRDPKVSDEELAKRQADAAQNRVSGMYGSARRDLGQYDDKTGFAKIQGPGKLQRDSSKNDIIAGIVAQGQAAGLTDQQIIAAVAIARHESDFNATIVGKGQGAFRPDGTKGDAYGLYQQTEGWGTVEQRTDPNYAISKFIESYQKTLAANPGMDPVAAASLTQNPQLGSGVAGSEYNKKTESFIAESAKAVQEAISSGATFPTDSSVALPGVGTGGLGYTNEPAAPVPQPEPKKPTPPAKPAPPPARKPGDPLFTSEGPEFAKQAFEHNKPFAKEPPLGSYQSKLTSGDEATFRKWVKDNKIPFNPDDPNADYDMRGYWFSQKDKNTQWKPGDHFPDTYKTPYDTTFSNESQYATANNPFKWQGDKLVDTRDNSVVFAPPPAAAPGSDGVQIVPAAPSGKTNWKVAPPDQPAPATNPAPAPAPAQAPVVQVPIAVRPVQGPSILHDTGKIPTQAAGRTTAALLQQIFGPKGLTAIGGSRDKDTVPNTHDKGLSIDVEIPGGDTSNGANPQGKALGDQMNAWLRANASKLGIKSTIWQNQWMDFNGNKSTVAGHMNHIDVHFEDGAIANIGPNGTGLTLPFGTGIKPDAFKFPSVLLGDEKKPDPERRWTKNPDGSFTEIHGDQAGQPPGELNPTTGKPYTDQELIDLNNAFPKQYDLTQTRPGDLTAAGVYQGSTEQQLNDLKENNPLLAQAIVTAQNKDGSTTQNQMIDALNTLSTERQKQLDLNTPAGRQAAGTLDSIISTGANEQGLTQQNPIDQVAQIAGGATSIAGDIFQVVNSVIDTIGATKDMTTTLARGVSNTEQIFSMVDDIQKFIQLGADIAGATSSVMGVVGSLVGAGGSGDPSGGSSGAAAAIAAVSQIAGLVQSGLETVNAVIDLGQEAYRIFGSYAGDFLGNLLGGPEGALQGNMKLLLDEKSHQLLAYSADNAQDKRAHTFLGQTANPDIRNQAVGTLNMYYQGYGQDPRDMTRQMMLQVRTSQLTGATNQ